MIRALAGAALVAGAVASLPATASAGPYDDDTVIVRYRGGDVPPAAELPALERAGVERAVDEIAPIDAQVLRVKGDPAAVAERLEDAPRVAYAEPNFLMRAQRRPNDRRFTAQWGLANNGQTGGLPSADIRALKGWSRAGLGRYPARGGARVGIVDTGVDLDHPDLQGRILQCAVWRHEDLIKSCRDDTGHGTHVAGILGARADNRAGVAGVAFNSPLLPCRALGGFRQHGLVSDIANCIAWAKRNGARVISMSFAGPRSRTLRTAIRRAWRGGRRGGAVLVAAAGNGGERSAAYPAAFRQVISVAATNDRDRHASFSNVHPTVELAAPGVNILSSWPGGGYARKAGTSMSTPYVAGVAAQVRRLRPGWPARRVRSLLRRTADDLGPRGRDQRYGYGRLNLARAVSRAKR